MKNFNTIFMGFMMLVSMAAFADATTQSKPEMAGQTSTAAAETTAAPSVTKKSETRKHHKKSSQNTTQKEEGKSKL